MLTDARCRLFVSPDSAVCISCVVQPSRDVPVGDGAFSESSYSDLSDAGSTDSGFVPRDPLRRFKSKQVDPSSKITWQRVGNSWVRCIGGQPAIYESDEESLCDYEPEGVEETKSVATPRALSPPEMEPALESPGSTVSSPSPDEFSESGTFYRVFLLLLLLLLLPTSSDLWSLVALLAPALLLLQLSLFV